MHKQSIVLYEVRWFNGEWLPSKIGGFIPKHVTYRDQEGNPKTFAKRDDAKTFCFNEQADKNIRGLFIKKLKIIVPARRGIQGLLLGIQALQPGAKKIVTV